MEKLSGDVFRFSCPPSVKAFASVAGKKEAEGPMGEYFDVTDEDAYLGEDTWEKAESRLQKTAVQKALQKAGLDASQIDFMFAGDLINQCTGSTYGIRDFQIPFFGIYGACSTMAEGLLLSAMAVNAGYAGYCLNSTSSHFSTAERQFRFPLSYGGQRTPTSQWTCTASGAVILSAEKSKVRICGGAAGTITDFGIKDANNEDALVVTSADIADYWGSSDDPQGYVYKQFTTQSSVKFEAPAPYFVKNITPAYGIVTPGESVELTASIKADDTMNAGATFNRLAIETNDPNNSTAYVTFNANIVGESLVAKAQLQDEAVDFGKVFRTSVAKMPVTVKNVGKDDFTINSVSFENGKFSTDQELPVTVKAGSSKDVIVTLPTEVEGAVSDVITVSTSAGDLTATLTGEVIGCPAIQLGFTEVNETVESGADLAKELTLTNNGSEPLTYSIVPGDFTSVYDPSMVNAKVSYLYSASVDDNNVKYEWVDIENGIGDRNGFSYYNTHDYLEVNLPFAFPFYGKEYTTMYIYNTGFVSFTERNDDKIWPEPPADFPTGSVYTNILAPYWGLHTMDTNTTAGTYHYITEDQAVISWMEYGNSMNLGVCFQLIMKKDGSFKFQYKGKDQNSIIYSTFGLAGACNEGGSEYFVIPDRYIQFGNAVQFSPVAESTIEPSQSKSVTLNIDTHKMAGNYTDAVTVNTNVPGSETVTVPVTLTVTGAAEPVFPTDITIEHVAGYQEQVTETSGPGVMYAGAPYEIPFSCHDRARHCLR